MNNFLEIYVCEKCKRFTVNTNETVTPIKQCFHQDGVYDMVQVYKSGNTLKDYCDPCATATASYIPDNM